MVDIATGETTVPEQTANEKRASKAGKVGGVARAKALTPAQRAEIATIAASTRWKKGD
ncbi:hypothetical protein [Sphingopyxis chilensis]